MCNPLLRACAVSVWIAVIAVACGGCRKKQAPPEPTFEQETVGHIARSIRIPVAAHAEPWSDAPVLVLEGANITVDGVPAGRVGTDPRMDELRNVLKSKRELWAMLNPGEAFPGVVLFAAARDLPGQTVFGVAQAVAATGYPELCIAVHAASRGPLAPENVGVSCVAVLIESDGSAGGGRPRSGMVVRLAADATATAAWQQGAEVTPSAPLDFVSVRGKRGELRYPGLARAVETQYSAHAGGDPIIVHGVVHLPLEGLVGVADTLTEAKQRFLIAVP